MPSEGSTFESGLPQSASTMSLASNPEADVDDLVHNHVAAAKLVSRSPSELVFRLPKEDTSRSACTSCLGEIAADHHQVIPKCLLQDCRCYVDTQGLL